MLNVRDDELDVPVGEGEVSSDIAGAGQAGQRRGRHADGPRWAS